MDMKTGILVRCSNQRNESPEKCNYEKVLSPVV